MLVINCPIFTSTNLVSWLHKRGQLLKISIRIKKHKIKILFDVTSNEIWYKRGIHIYHACGQIVLERFITRNAKYM